MADHVLAARGGGDAVVVGHGVARGGGSSFGGRCADLVADLVGGAGVVPGAVDVDAGVVHDDVRAFLGEEESDGASDATAGAGYDGGAAFEFVGH